MLPLPPVSKSDPPSLSENHGELYLVLPQPLHRLTERICWLGAISLEEVSSSRLLQVTSSISHGPRVTSHPARACLQQERALAQISSGWFRRQAAEGHVSPAPAPGTATARVALQSCKVLLQRHKRLRRNRLLGNVVCHQGCSVPGNRRCR